MGKQFFVNPNKFYLKLNGLKEGGMSRNHAWEEFIKKNTEYKEFILSANRNISTLQIIRFLYTKRNSTIFMLYPSVGIPIFTNTKFGRILTNLFLNGLQTALKHHNKIILDICDLKYEQAKDLQIDYYDIDYLHDVERRLFSLDLYYIFASQSMAEYAAQKYHLSNDKFIVCKNGGEVVEQSHYENSNPNSKVKLVYAGTLNKGRMIEQMIDQLKSAKNIELILMGIGGEWIKNEFQSYDFINYLGAKPENECRKIVSECDLGLIPYDSSRFYFNIAYPTKLSFYLTCGIPFLSTDVQETRRIIDDYGDLGIIAEINNWSNVIDDITTAQINKYKSRISKCKHQFTWEESFHKALDMLG